MNLKKERRKKRRHLNHFLECNLLLLTYSAVYIVSKQHSYDHYYIGFFLGSFLNKDWKINGERS